MRGFSHHTKYTYYHKAQEIIKYFGKSMKQVSTKDKKYLGAQIGFMEVLHTWGQTLVFHPHIHAIVPAGGLNKLSKWKESKKKFFIPVKVMSRKFRGKFLHYLKQEKLEFYGANLLANHQ